MSTVIAKNVQVGTSGTATNNFTLYQPASPDGTVRLANGNSGTTTDLVTVTSAGNVGIGTTSPVDKVSLYSATSVYQRFQNSTTGTGASDGFQLGNDATNAYVWNYEATPIIFATSNAVRAAIDSSGNVGIGTSSPGALLDVSAAGTAVAKLTNRNSGATEVVLSLDAGGNGVSVRDSQIRGGNNGANQTYLSFYTANAAAPVERAQITSDGNLRIGISSGGAARIYTRGATSTSASFPFYADNAAGSACLYVRGDGALSTGTAGLSPYSLTTGNAANMFVDASGFLYRSTSSLKYKTEVQDAVHGLTEVMALRPVTYKTNGTNAAGETPTQVYGGLIAEEVHAAGLNEFVQYAEDGTPDALSYGNMVSLCVKAIQEQQAMIEQLKADVAALKAGQAPTETP
jgi:hypothetical protein